MADWEVAEGAVSAVVLLSLLLRLLEDEVVGPNHNCSQAEETEAQHEAAGLSTMYEERPADVDFPAKDCGWADSLLVEVSHLVSVVGCVAC